MDLNDAVYSTLVTVKGGREGNVSSDHGNFNLDITTPEAFGGQGTPKGSYLDLLGAALASCYSNALQEAARIDDHVEEAFADVATQIDVLKDPERGGFKLRITLLVKLFGGRYSDILDQRVFDEASGLCPLLKALEGECELLVRKL
ncbi:organic hydroperoxide reductase OsmC/OhrA [Bacillus ectoiniformans]|uniref:OsmC family protein n=1 Tax=Bacillus ectoiniformans TaxID=1494429 RepID=UPI00195B7115|nr:hypothetical protein [Bacillus ectoiniformans]MBM7647339.1 organic hydroperoxide reductase OsmC/OhrA [Bacillus ectoiniformans]